MLSKFSDCDRIYSFFTGSIVKISTLYYGDGAANVSRTPLKAAICIFIACFFLLEKLLEQLLAINSVFWSMLRIEDETLPLILYYNVDLRIMTSPDHRLRSMSFTKISDS